MSRVLRSAIVIAPVVARLKSVDGVLGLHDDAEAFDYACGVARANAIDRILLDFFEASGWSIDDEAVLDIVTVEHDGDHRARILVRGQPATPWWQDRVERGETEITWWFEQLPAEDGASP